MFKILILTDVNFAMMTSSYLNIRKLSFIVLNEFFSNILIITF